jgi:hypothetical protein
MRRSHSAVALASLVTERDWQRQLTDLLELRGWSWVHVRAGRTEHGWRVPTSGPLAAGWPDIVAARPARPGHPGRLVFIECKAQDGRLSEAQRAVHDTLRASGCEVFTWRPADLPEVLEILR